MKENNLGDRMKNYYKDRSKTFLIKRMPVVIRVDGKSFHTFTKGLDIPKEEVTNCILWRQQDATKNSISSIGRTYFSHKELENLNSNQIQELLFSKKELTGMILQHTLREEVAV